MLPNDRCEMARPAESQISTTPDVREEPGRMRWLATVAGLGRISIAIRSLDGADPPGMPATPQPTSSAPMVVPLIPAPMQGEVAFNAKSFSTEPWNAGLQSCGSAFRLLAPSWHRLCTENADKQL